MKLIEFKEQTNIIAKDQPEYIPMPAYIWEETVNTSHSGKITCCWKLSLIERLKLLFTGVIWHDVLTFFEPLQPQRLSVKKPKFGESPEVIITVNQPSLKATSNS